MVHLAADSIFAMAAMLCVTFTMAVAFHIFNLVAEIFGANKIIWRTFFEHGFTDPLRKGLFFSTMCATTFVPTLVHLCAGCGAILLAPLPGKNKVASICMKGNPTALEKTIITFYLWLSGILLVIGGLVLVASVWLALIHVGKPLFFGTLDLVTQLL